jgi:hypothetical protein
VEQPIYGHFTDKKNLSQRDEDDDSRTEIVDENLKTETGDSYSVSEDAGTLSRYGKPAETVFSTGL